MPTACKPGNVMATRSFDRLVLGFVGTAVLASAAWMMTNPPSRTFSVPRVVFAMPQSEDAAMPEHRTGGMPLNGVREVSAIDADVKAVSLYNAQSIADSFERMGYHLDRIRGGETRVPRVFLAKLPDDMPSLQQVELRKTVFFKTMLPLVLKENERILNDRRRLYRLRTELRLGHTLDPVDRLWLSVMADRYETEDNNFEELLRRVDAVPPSLALAQAAEESGWGTSRFAQHGNALFGQWTFKGKGLVPEDREDGKTHKVKKFDSLAQSVAAYIHNLNTHDAYVALRAKRATFRRVGAPLSGEILAKTLTKYSERGEDYVSTILTIMSANELKPLDDARLSNDGTDGAA